MKKAFYTLLILFTFSLGFQLNQLNAQCTDFVAGPFVDFNNAFGGAPCDDGSGCAFNEIDGFEVFASESYLINNFIAGGEYAFSICNGPNAGTWVPDFTIQAPSGAIDAFGPGDGDGCTISWTASEDGAYTIIINQQKNCGGGPNTSTNNGFPAITCTNAPCGEAPPCSAGTLTTVGDVAVCDATGTFDLAVEMDTIPTDGGYAWGISDVLGGTGGLAGGFSLTNSNPISTFDADLNGVLSSNNLPPLTGAWVFRGITIDAAGNACSLTADSLIVRFGTESPAITEITLSGSGELTVNATGGVEPYSYLWDDPAAQTTQTAVGLDAGIVYTVIVVDANGCLVSGESEATVSTNSISSLNAHSIVPNPNNGSFSVQLNFDNSEFVEVEVLDITGRIVETANRELTSGNFDFNLENTAEGVYFVRIIAGEESITQRIIVSK